MNLTDDFQLRRHNGITFLVCRPLEQAGYTHAFSTRQHGVSPLPTNALNLGFCPADTPSRVRHNRQRFLAAMGATKMKLVTLRQTHSANVLTVRQDNHADAPNTGDALITTQPGLLLGVQTADCVPILLADVKRRAIAAIHAGWRGTHARIVEKTLARMQYEFGTDAADCLAAIGPAARVCCYEVGQDVVELFSSTFPWADAIICNHQPTGKAHLDIPAANRQQLIHAGVPQSTIFTVNLCTICHNELFFSHRRESAHGVGRMLSVIGMSECDRSAQPNKA